MRDLSKKHVSGCVDPLRKKVSSKQNREFPKIHLHHPIDETLAQFNLSTRSWLITGVFVVGKR